MTATFTAAEALAHWATAYGSGPLGILSEDLAHSGLLDMGVVERTAANGSTWVAPREGGKAYRVTCSEVTALWIDGEELSTRCGLPTHDGLAWCEGHAAAYNVKRKADLEATCSHGLAAWLCADPVTHYPTDL